MASNNPGAKKTSVIFPAFVPEFTGLEEKAILDHADEFARMLEVSSGMLNIDLAGFDFQHNNFTDDEEKSQYISYIFSCFVAGILKEHHFRPEYVSGYSMGIYAALYYCGSISFDDGLLLVRRAWELISDATRDGDYGMGMIVGLSEQDILQMVDKEGRVVICNQNNPHTFIISGDAAEICQVLSSAKEEGALRANPLPVSKPYHTDVLRGATPEFNLLLDEITFSDPIYPYLSGLDLRILKSSEELRRELLTNLYHRMDWLGAMKKMTDHGTEVFFECGLGDGLTRNFRFIDRSVKAYAVDKLELLI